MNESLAFKILVAGPIASGKTTFVQTVNEIEWVNATSSLSPNELLKRHQEMEVNKKLGKVMDFGRKTLEEDLVLYFLGAPKVEWYDEVLPHVTEVDFLGYVVILDSTDSSTFREGRKLPVLLQSYHLAPMVFAANKQDRPNAWSPDDLRIALRIPADIPVMPCVANNKESVKNVLLALLTRVMDELDK